MLKSELVFMIYFFVMNLETKKQLKSLIRILQNFQKENFIDFSKIDWIQPILLLPLSAFIDKNNFKYKNISSIISDYLNIIKFPEGVDNKNTFQRILQSSSKTYTPIIKLKNNNTKDREDFKNLFFEKLFQFLPKNQEKDNKNSYWLPLSELITNIFEHSGENFGYTLLQYYPNKKVLEVCIVDTGKGFSENYKQHQNINLSDIEAIREALKGNSTKGEERGYGLRTSKDLITKGMQGEFILISGEALYFADSKKEQIFPFPINWQGVIVSYRVPLPESKVDIYNFVE